MCYENAFVCAFDRFYGGSDSASVGAGYSHPQLRSDLWGGHPRLSDGCLWFRGGKLDTGGSSIGA